jgi:signal transduction histidine kinase
MEAKTAIPEFLAGGGEMGQRIREYDWSATPLGPIEGWPQNLRTCVRIMLTSRQPIWLGWGKELTKLYNDPYRAIVGGKHPGALGLPASVVWKAIWREIGPMLETVMEKDEGTYAESQLLIMERNGYPEETYYTFSYTPIPGDDGGTAGMICFNVDDTDRIHGERQLQTLTRLGKYLTECRDYPSAVLSTMASLAANPYDFPFGLYYSMQARGAVLENFTELGEAAGFVPALVEVGSSAGGSLVGGSSGGGSAAGNLGGAGSGNGSLVGGGSGGGGLVGGSLAGGGSPVGGLAAEGERFGGEGEALAREGNGLGAAMWAASASRQLQIVEGLGRVLGPMPRGAWEVAPDKAVVLPIFLPGAKGAAGFLVMGLNPYRPPDERYLNYCTLVADQLATSFADIYSLEMERSRAEALAEIDRAKTLFFSNISHEFRTPLTLLLGPITDLLSDPASVEANRYRLGVAYRNALRMQKLVNTLLEFSRLEAGRLEGRFQRVDIAVVTLDLASSFRSAIERAGMTLRTHAGVIGDAVYVDLELWERIVLNLVSNAFKYSVEGEIGVGVYSDGAAVRVTVTDTGSGIPADQLDKIFDRFHRVENSGARSLEGTGIGLAMVRELVWLHGGTIAVESEFGRGSTFTVTIPVGSAHLPADRILREQGVGLRSIHQLEAFVQEAERWADDSPAAGGAGGAAAGGAAGGAAADRSGVGASGDGSGVAGAAAGVAGGGGASGVGAVAGGGASGDGAAAGVGDGEAVEGDGAGGDGAGSSGEWAPMTVVPREELGDFGDGRGGLGDGRPRTRYTVVLADDNADMREYVERLLSPQFNVITAKDGQDALEKMLAHRPDLLLTDVMMPRLDGFSLLKMIRETPEIQHVPVILLSAQAGEEAKIEGLEAGADDYLVKPFGARELLARVDSNIRIAKDRVAAMAAYAEKLEQAVRRRTQELRKLNHSLETSNEDLQQFAHVASHDLKEPVRKIRTFTGRLLDEYAGHLPHEAVSFLQKIMQATIRMGTMIEGVLTYSILNSNEHPMGPIDLNEIFTQIESDLELVIQETGAEVRRGELPHIEGGRVLIYQLFYNLINNALKFSRNVDKPLIVIESRVVEGAGKRFAELTVRDNGIGFDAAQADKIFEAFARLNSKDKFEGTGLGLSLCKKIAERHHGSITATGVRGEGAVFVVRLPLIQTERSI